MKLIQRYRFLGVFLVFAFFIMGHAFAIDLSPAGYWAVRNNKGNVTGIVQIWQQQGRYYGKVIKIYPVDGNKPTERCVKCKGVYYNQPILGMVVLHGVINKGNYYSGGTILDPQNGQVYRVHLTLFSNGNKMRVRGYVGTPIFGRTQIWTRVSIHEIKD